MKLVVLGSSSKGNGYIISDSRGNALLLEAGMPAATIRAAMLEHQVHICACLVSHKHGDHARHIADVIKMGIPVYADTSVLERVTAPSRYVRPVTGNATVTVPAGFASGKESPAFTVRFLSVEHDVPCFAFFVTHPEGRIFFITDTMYSDYILPNNLSLAMVECNYDDETLDYNIDNGITEPAMRSRLLQTHMELKTTVDMLTQATGTRQILLLHLSHDNADPELMLKKVMSATAVPTHIARPGLVLDF